MHRDIDITAQLARHALSTGLESLPDKVREEAARAFLNWVGVAIGGSGEPAVIKAAAYVESLGSAPRAKVIGRGGQMTDPANAALVNCISSAVLAYDDAYLPSVAHPSGPAAAALFALAQDRGTTGAEFLNALALSIELQCRLANMLSLAPSPFHPSLYVNGFSGPVGVAAGAARMLRLTEEQTIWALGLAASQASGFRGTHGTMTAHFRAGHCSRVGLVAAMMAEAGFDCAPAALEGPGGFFDVYADGADPGHLLDELGQRHVMLDNRYKPYPCGIVIHPTIDACLALRDRLPKGAQIAALRLTVHPVVLSLTGRRTPTSPIEAPNSVYHWAAAALLRGRAGLAEMQMDCITDPHIHALRSRIEATDAPAMGKGEAVAELELDDGTRLREHVTSARGSLKRPMNTADLEVKFRDVVRDHLAPDRMDALIAACRDIGQAGDVGAEIGRLLP